MSISDSTSNEIWRDVPGYEGLYRVSSGGHLISLWKQSPRMMKPSDRQGYKVVNLFKSDSTHRTWLVHRIVMLAFCGEPPIDKREVNHKNGVRNDNRLDNLEYITSAGNKHHARDVLKANYGNRKTDRATRANYSGKLKEADVLLIRQQLADGVDLHEIAAQHKVTWWTINNIRKGAKWSHLPYNGIK